MQRRWWTLIAVSVATFMLLLDVTVVNVALPSIREDLGASFTDLQWVVDAYALALAALVLTAGSLADRLGRRRLFHFGLAIFSTASLLCALAPDPLFLNLSRGLQGAGGAGMFAVSLAMIAQEFPSGRARGTAMGIYGATIGVAVAIGPLIGGALTDSLGWESIFYVNVPIGIAAILISHAKLRESRDPGATRIDWPGVATFSSSLFLLVLALVRGNDEGWGSSTILSLFALSALLLVGFVVLERRAAEPMLPLGLFRRPAFTGIQIAALAISAAAMGMLLFVSLYFQNLLGYSPLEAGLRYLPVTVLAFLVSPLSGAMLSRVPARSMLFVGLTTVGGGLLLMSGVTVESEWTTLLGGFIVLGIGIGLLNPVIADVAISVVPNEKSGMASGVNSTFRQFGIALGVAIWGAIFVSAGAGRVREVAGGASAASGDHPRDLIEASSSGALPELLASLPEKSRSLAAHAAREGFVTGFNRVLILGALVSFAGAILSLALVREQEAHSAPARSDGPIPQDGFPGALRDASSSPVVYAELPGGERSSTSSTRSASRR